MDIATKDQIGTCEQLKTKITQIISVVKRNEVSKQCKAINFNNMLGNLTASNSIIERGRVSRPTPYATLQTHCG